MFIALQSLPWVLITENLGQLAVAMQHAAGARRPEVVEVVAALSPAGPNLRRRVFPRHSRAFCVD
eukprot:11197580-Lingulodinium_polyedra.AAC.1